MREGLQYAEHNHTLTSEQVVRNKKKKKNPPRTRQQQAPQFTASPANTKPCFQRSSVLFSRSEMSEESYSGPEREEREEGLLTGGVTSCSPPHRPLLTVSAREQHTRRSPVCRGLSALRQNPVYLPNNLIYATQPELKTRYRGYYYYRCVFWILWQRCAASAWEKLQMTQF